MKLDSFSITYTLNVLTGIDGSSTFETAARTSGYGDSLDLVISGARRPKSKGGTHSASSSVNFNLEAE